MKNIEKIAEELFNKIRSRFERVSIGTSEAESTDDPTKARFFNFDYTDRQGKNYGSITISLADENSLKLLFSKKLIDQVETDPKAQESWFNFLKGIRYFAKRNLMTFDARDITRSNLTVRDLKTDSKHTDAYDLKDNPVTESKLYGSSRTSIQEFGASRLIIKHSQAVNEEVPGARSRRIDSLFIENDQGERFRLPFKKLSAGRAMAEHVAHGGYVYDAVGKHITGMVEEMSNLAFFVRNTKNRVFEDSETKLMVEAAVERYYSIRNDLHGMSSVKGYRQFAENFKQQPMFDDKLDLEELKERFVKKMFDQRLESALPYVHRAYKNKVDQADNQYVSEFENWADDTVNSDIDELTDLQLVQFNELMQNEIAVGLDGVDAIGALKNIVDDEELNDQLIELSRDQGVDADARPVIASWAEQQGIPVSYTPEPEVQPTQPAPNSLPTADDTPPVVSEIRRLAGI
jgi:hypothetical protein